jgi:hypothetical protein
VKVLDLNPPNREDPVSLQDTIRSILAKLNKRVQASQKPIAVPHHDPRPMMVSVEAL